MSKQTEQVLPLIPMPRTMGTSGQGRRVGPALSIAIQSGEAEDRWAAEQFAKWIQQAHGAKASVSDAAAKQGWTMTIARRKGGAAESYRLSIDGEAIALEGSDAAGVFYGLATLRQMVRLGDGQLTAAQIEDEPALRHRAIHVDTKHHQPTAEYVFGLIDEMAQYKVNILVWEWEDKFAYESHPQIGAPGAFTRKQMQEFTAYARQRHMQIVPLVQGLGHASYILKFPQFRHLREVPDSNWQFNPLEDRTYELLFALFDEAMEATPQSQFIHIGSDETYELGQERSREYAEKHGKPALMKLFIQRCVEHCESKGRKVLSWGGKWRPDQRPEDSPPKSMIFVDSGRGDYLSAAKSAGFHAWVYAHNPGIVPLVLPLYQSVHTVMWEENGRSGTQVFRGAFANTADPISATASAGSVEGSITTSWDDSGLHLQAWVPRWVCAAEFSWNPEKRDLERWGETFYANYFGQQARDLRELFTLLFEGANFYYHTFQRAVWHWFNLGKMHLPDLPRFDLELNPYFRVRYRELISRARQKRNEALRAIDIIDQNRGRGAEHDYDLEIYRTCAELMRHNTDLIITLADVEAALDEAWNKYHHLSGVTSVQRLRDAQQLIRDNLQDREAVYNNLVQVWERTRLPKGLSLPDKPYAHARDRARHFANRTADMSYLIVDEQLLNLEGYLKELEAATDRYEQRFVKNAEKELT